MEVLKIKGGKPLKGQVRAAGAKNAMTKLLVASLLSDKRCRFYNVPDIGDVDVTVALCKEIGMEVQWDREAGVMEVITRDFCFPPETLIDSMRRKRSFTAVCSWGIWFFSW